MRRAPEFWSHAEGPEAAPVTRALLEPVSWLYQTGARVKARAIAARRAGPPVLCVGNLTMGGAGKTPVAIALLQRLIDRGVEAHALSRGYGGKLKGPVRVDEEAHDFRDVGDEALLLSRIAPTWVSKSKIAGARAAAAAGAEAIIMDDGFQNPSIVKDMSLVVIDAETGLGNGRVFPAGPLREHPVHGLTRANAVVLMNAPIRENALDDPDTLQPVEPPTPWRAFLPDDVPVLEARVTPRGPLPRGGIFAFAGIARPQKFFDALNGAGADIKATATYPDHHPFSADDLTWLRDNARRHNALLVTTEKDHVRLPREIRRLVHCWPVAAEFETPPALDRLIDDALDRAALHS